MGAKFSTTARSTQRVPGAGQYDIKEIIGREAVSKSIGEYRELKRLKGELGPGPGGY